MHGKNNVFTSMCGRKKKNMTLPLHAWVGMIKSLTVPNYLILQLIKYESYGFNADLIEAIN